MIESEQGAIASLKKDVEYIVKFVDEFKDFVKNSEKENERRFVLKSEFWPVKTIVYTGASIVLIAFMTAIVSTIIK